MQVLHLSVGHVSYDGAGSRAPITSASVQVSVDNGVTGSASRPVTATDASGGSISQTVANAYTAE